ncbi:MAG TPA: hypothetical protein VGN36_05210, partial [Sphingorhabdus sp.]|nr:hypothetical protein [Sphingorhabdus sp.]
MNAPVGSGMWKSIRDAGAVNRVHRVLEYRSDGRVAKAGSAPICASGIILPVVKPPLLLDYL